MKKQNNRTVRWAILVAGVFTMLFAGVLYAWSIFKVPLLSELKFDGFALDLNFTLTISFFCLGGLLSSKLVKLIGTKLTIVVSGLLAGLGFVLSSFLTENTVWLMYVTYAFMGGLGIGISYITIISTVNSWFPDRKGFSSGALMMGFGASTLILGNLANSLFAMENIGWRKTYIIVGAALGAVILLSSLVIKRPSRDAELPMPKNKTRKFEESFEPRDFKPTEMIRTFTFWRAFICLICITAVGNTVISFAKQLVESVGAQAALATTLVGVFAICNGLGRIMTGALFDVLGRRITMICANLLTIIAAAMTLIAVSINSLPLCIIGLCLTGVSYGTSPTVSSAFTAAFYGQKNFAANLGVMNFNLMAASFIATACSSAAAASGGYTVPFIILLALASFALVLNFSIKRP